jgi:hypothetical protein
MGYVTHQGSNCRRWVKQPNARSVPGDSLSPVALQEKARAAGLLGERQRITDSKSFRSAKAALGVPSHRIGFGSGATWFWALRAPPAPQVTTPVTLPVDVYEFAPADRAPKTSPCYAESMCGRPGALLEWTQAVALVRLSIVGAFSLMTVGASLAARWRSAPLNLAGILPARATLGAQACCGI